MLKEGKETVRQYQTLSPTLSNTDPAARGLFGNGVFDLDSRIHLCSVIWRYSKKKEPEKIKACTCKTSEYIVMRCKQSLQRLSNTVRNKKYIEIYRSRKIIRFGPPWRRSGRRDLGDCLPPWIRQFQPQSKSEADGQNSAKTVPTEENEIQSTMGQNNIEEIWRIFTKEFKRAHKSSIQDTPRYWHVRSSRTAHSVMRLRNLSLK